ncbi:gustatory receptor [Homalodisca vitripennis]|nr:gustatory receptor [Homalodisca vitripennis]KAG8329082.1 gustatory receptor [Homalodisca vitripennis]
MPNKLVLYVTVATPPYETIKDLMNTYWMLCDATCQVNIFFSDQMIAAILALIVQLTINLFYFFHRVAQHDIIFIVNDGLWSLAFFLVLIFLSHSSTRVTKSAEELAPMIYKMMTLDLDPRLKRQLEIFLVQLSNSHVGFSARGYFHINNEMITSIVGMVTTYLVVLIQFHTAVSTTQH